MFDLNDKTVLITGGTGSFGNKFTEMVIKNFKPYKLIIFSRDEMKQYYMAQKFSPDQYKFIRYFIGDIRDQERLYRAFHNVDIVIHAAALKIITSGEYNPIEVIKTNVIGANNIINAAIDQRVNKVLALSTDKAVNPINLYGASKLAAEKLFIAANNYSGDSNTQFSCVRYGNVINSRGSVIPLWKEQAKTGKITLTDERMTRFFITLEKVADFIFNILEMMKGREVFVPKMPSMKIIDLAKAIAPNAKIEFIGIRPGEKLNETLISEDEAHHTVEFDKGYIILPELEEDYNQYYYSKYKKVSERFKYSSDTNSWWINQKEILQLI